MVLSFFFALFVSIISTLVSADGGAVTFESTTVSYTGAATLFEGGTSYTVAGCSIPNADTSPGWAVRSFTLPESVSNLQQELTVTYLNNIKPGVSTADPAIDFQFYSLASTTSFYGLTIYPFNFGAEFTTYLYTEMSGYYAIHVHDTDDNLAVIVGASNAFDCCTGAIASGATPLYIANLNTSPKAAEKIGYVYMEQGLYYPIRVVYGNLMANAQAHIAVLDPNGVQTSNLYRMNSIDECSIETYAPSNFPTTTVAWTGVSTTTVFPTASGTVTVEVPGNFSTSTATEYILGSGSASTSIKVISLDALGEIGSTYMIENVYEYAVPTTSYDFFNPTINQEGIVTDSLSAHYVYVVGTSVAELDFITDAATQGVGYIFDPPADAAALGTATIVLGDNAHLVDEPFFEFVQQTSYDIGVVDDEYYVLAFTHSGNYSTMYYQETTTEQTFLMDSGYSIELVEFIPRPTTTVTTTRTDVSANVTVTYTPPTNDAVDKVTVYQIVAEPGNIAITTNNLEQLTGQVSQITSMGDPSFFNVTGFQNFSNNVVSTSLGTHALDSSSTTSETSSTSFSDDNNGITTYTSPIATTSIVISGITAYSTVTVMAGAEEVVEIPQTYTFHEPIFPGIFTESSTLTTYYSNFPMVIEYDQPVITISYDGSLTSYSTYYPNNIFEPFEVYEFYPTVTAIANASTETDSSTTSDGASLIVDSVIPSDADTITSTATGIPGLGDIDIPLSAVDQSTIQISEIMAEASRLAEQSFAAEQASESAAIASVKSLAMAEAATNGAAVTIDAYAADGKSLNAQQTVKVSGATITGDAAVATGDINAANTIIASDDGNEVVGTVTVDNNASADDADNADDADLQYAAQSAAMEAVKSEVYSELSASYKSVQVASNTASGIVQHNTVTEISNTAAATDAASSQDNGSIVVDSKYTTGDRPAYAFTFHAAPESQTSTTSEVSSSSNATVSNGVVKTYEVVTSFSVVLKADATQSSKSHKGDAAGQHIVGSSVIYGFLVMLLALI